MIRLLATELGRIRSRRAATWLLLLALLAAGLLTAKTAYDTRALTPQDRANASAQAALAADRPAMRAEIEACEAQPKAYLGADAAVTDCASALAPEASSFYPRQPLDLRQVLSGEGRVPGNAIALVMLLTVLLLVGASIFAGADWASRSIVNQLVVQPRRVRVWTAKALAVLLWSALSTLVLVGGFWAALTAVASSRGLEVSSADLGLVAGFTWRAVALGAAAAVGGYAVTMLFRHTVATMALVFAYAVGGEIAINLIPVDGAGRWALGNNVFGWLRPQHRYFDPTISCGAEPGCSPWQTMTHLEAALFLGIALLLAVVVSLLSFRRRDV